MKNGRGRDYSKLYILFFSFHNMSPPGDSSMLMTILFQKAHTVWDTGEERMWQQVKYGDQAGPLSTLNAFDFFQNNIKGF